MALGENDIIPRNHETRLDPMLNNRGIFRMISFAISDENNQGSPTPIRIVSKVKRIPRDETPFSPSFRKIVSKDSDND